MKFNKSKIGNPINKLHLFLFGIILFLFATTIALVLQGQQHSPDTRASAYNSDGNICETECQQVGNLKCNWNGSKYILNTTCGYYDSGNGCTVECQQVGNYFCTWVDTTYQLKSQCNPSKCAGYRTETQCKSVSNCVWDPRTPQCARVDSPGFECFAKEDCAIYCSSGNYYYDSTRNKYFCYNSTARCPGRPASQCKGECVLDPSRGLCAPRLKDGTSCTLPYLCSLCLHGYKKVTDWYVCGQ